MNVLIDVHGATKRFGSVTALNSVDFRLGEGEVVALLGDNGAGKSTLIRCLSGVHPLDEGMMTLDGEPYNPRTPAQAQALGIATVYQDLALFDNLTVADNFFAGRELVRPRWLGHLGILRKREMRAVARRSFEELQISIPQVDEPVGLMSGGQRQSIAVGRAESVSRRIIILDEPTAALGMRESRNVWNSILRLRDRGISVVLISHNLDEVFAVADRATVLRRGRNVGEAPARREFQAELVGLIVGADDWVKPGDREA